MGKIGDWISGKLSGIWSGIKDFGGKIAGAATFVKDIAGKAASIPIVGLLLKKAYEMIPPRYRAAAELGLDVAEGAGKLIKTIDTVIPSDKPAIQRPPPRVSIGAGASGKIIPFYDKDAPKIALPEKSNLKIDKLVKRKNV
jgi:hypothetical protein